MKKFVKTRYTVTTEKLSKKNLTFVMVSDLHNVVFGEKNEKLLSAIREEKPDAILIAGDLVLGKKKAPLAPALEFLKEAVKIAPVYYSLGNHEHRMKLYPETFGRDYLVFEKRIRKLGVHLLENRTAHEKFKGEAVAVTGLALPHFYYNKGKKKQLTVRELNHFTGRASAEEFQILLAHTPRYTREYLAWGADLALSGHYHGGMVRVPGLGGAISPDLRLFPRYCRGKFQEGDRTAIVSAGLGEHTIPLRIFNPRELLVITCKPGKKKAEGVSDR